MRKKSAKRILTLLLALVMMLAMCIPSFAAEDSTLTATDDPRESIMLMTLGYEDDNGSYLAYQAGTSFLINDEYVLTNKHVVTVSNDNWNDFVAFVKTNFGVENVQANDSHIKLYLYVNRDMKVEATMHDSVNSSDLDFAAVKLSEKIYDRKPVALGESSTLQVKDDVYAMGFPADSISTKEYNTKDDVSTSAGKVSKLTVTGNVDIIEHSAQLTNGNSGGPLLDSNNQVVGVNTFIAGQKSYSIQIDYIKNALDTFGIAYVSGSSSSSDSTEEVDVRTELGDAIASAKSLDLSSYTSESQAAYNNIINSADEVYANDEATDEELQSALSDVQGASSSLVAAETDDTEETAAPAKKSNMGLMIAIAAAVIIIIVIIIVVVMKSGKKKNAPVPGPTPMQAGAPQQNGFQSQAPQQRPYPNPAPQNLNYGAQGSDDTSLLNAGAGETTLLDAGAGETSLLGGGSKAYLIRKKNGEKISINSVSFKIGKERRRVNYCVSDNTSVSRVHCEIIRKGADYYIVDQGATNFTFVNGVQLSPHKETILSDRSVVKLADEEFEFHLS